MVSIASNLAVLMTCYTFKVPRVGKVDDDGLYYLCLCVFLWLISPIGDKHRRPHSGHVMVGFVADGNGGTFLLFRRWESVSKRLDS